MSSRASSRVPRVMARAVQTPGKPEERGSGFTLLELVVVLSLLALMTAAVMPIYQGALSKVKAEQSIRDLIARMKYAQAMAVMEAIEHRVYFRPKENAYWIARLAVTQDMETVFEPLRNVHGDYTVLPSTLRMEKPRARLDREAAAYFISFFPSGACDRATVRIAQRKARHKYYEISTTGTLSQLQVKEP